MEAFVFPSLKLESSSSYPYDFQVMHNLILVYSTSVGQCKSRHFCFFIATPHVGYSLICAEAMASNFTALDRPINGRIYVRTRAQK